MSGLRTVHIKRFKNITDAVFNLSDINVIVGANNSGKSSILQAIHFAVGAIQSLKLEGLLNRPRVKTQTVDPSKLIYIPSDDVHALGWGGRLWEEKDKSVQIELGIRGGEQLTISMRKGRNRNIQISVSDVTIASALADLEHPFSVFTPGLAGIAKTEEYVSDGVLLRTIARGDANLVLRNTLLRLWNSQQQNSNWSEFINDLAEIFPNIRISVSFNPQTDEFINVKIETVPGAIPLELSGTSVLQSIQILSYIHYFSPYIIVLDEPDSHLHPNNQRLLCSLLNGIVQERNVQVILSTHSRHILDALQNTANFLWARNGSVETVRNGADLAILLDLGALDLRERISAGLKVCIVLTEDERVQSLKAVLESSGFDMSSTSIFPSYGCTAPHYLRPLINMIKNVNQQAVIVVHKDRDYHSDNEINAWQTTIRSMGAEPFVTDGVDIESHLLKAEYLAELNSNLTIEEMRIIINQAMVDMRDESIRKYVNGRSDIARKTQTFGGIDLGELAIQAPREYDSNPQKCCHSKTVMAKVRQLFQTNYHVNLRTQERSHYLACPMLLDIARRTFRQDQ